MSRLSSRKDLSGKLSLARIQFWTSTCVSRTLSFEKRENFELKTGKLSCYSKFCSFCDVDMHLFREMFSTLPLQSGCEGEEFQFNSKLNYEFFCSSFFAIFFFSLSSIPFHPLLYLPLSLNWIKMQFSFPPISTGDGDKNGCHFPLSTCLRLVKLKFHGWLDSNVDVDKLQVSVCTIRRLFS